MLLGVDPLEGILDAKLLVPVRELLAAHQYPLARLASTADVMHAVVVEDDLHATVAIGDLIRLVERLGELDELELDGIIILPGNYLKVHTHFQIRRKLFR